MCPISTTTPAARGVLYRRRWDHDGAVGIAAGARYRSGARPRWATGAQRILSACRRRELGCGFLVASPPTTQLRTASAASKSVAETPGVLHAPDVVVIAETRYRGVYEGGPWAAFAVSEIGAIPVDAFAGDPFASGWWDEPSVPVGVGDSPNDALSRLTQLMTRDRDYQETGLFGVGQVVRVAGCTPEEWYGSGNGIVRSVAYRPSRPYTGGLRGQCVYTIDFEDRAGAHVPERYLRSDALMSNS